MAAIQHDDLHKGDFGVIGVVARRSVRQAYVSEDTASRGSASVTVRSSYLSIMSRESLYAGRRARARPREACLYGDSLSPAVATASLTFDAVLSRGAVRCRRMLVAPFRGGSPDAIARRPLHRCGRPACPGQSRSLVVAAGARSWPVGLRPVRLAGAAPAKRHG